jgi:hypothetical protein
MNRGYFDIAKEEDWESVFEIYGRRRDKFGCSVAEPSLKTNTQVGCFLDDELVWDP